MSKKQVLSCFIVFSAFFIKSPSLAIAETTLGRWAQTQPLDNSLCWTEAAEYQVDHWIPATPLFLSSQGGRFYETWTGHTAIIRAPENGDPEIFILGGVSNTLSSYADGVFNGVTPYASSTAFNNQISADGTLSHWAAPFSGGSLPMASILHSSTLSGSLIYIFGGANTLNAHIWAGAAGLSITAAWWGEPLTAVHQPGAARVFYETTSGDGQGGTGPFEETAAIPIIDRDHEPTSIYQPFIRAVAVSHLNNIYVLGGISRENIGPYNTPTGSVPVYEDRVWYCRPNPGGTINSLGSPGGWKITEPLPQALYDFSACVAYDRIYIFGGNDANSIPQKKVYFAEFALDGTLGSWQETASLPVPMAQHAVVFVSGHFFAVGGENSSGSLINAAYCSRPDPVSGFIPSPSEPGGWITSQAVLESGVAEHKIAAYNNVVYLFGGRYNLHHASSTYMTASEPLPIPTPIATPTQAPSPSHTSTPINTATSTIDLKGKSVIAYPNPGSDFVAFSWEESQFDKVDIFIFNPAGERIAKLHSLSPCQGLTWSTQGIPPGIYLYQVFLSLEGKETRLPVKKIAIIK